ncbi:MAG TPA: IPT/TIG domain-containing protein [Candidatus Anoxymicrobiaceae bacterium]
MKGRIGPATWTDISSSLIGVATSSLLVDEGNNILYVGLSVGSVQHGVYRIAHPTTTPTAVNTNMVAPVSATIGYSLNALVQDSDRNVLYCATGEQTGKAYLGTSPNASCSWSSISQMGTNVDVKALCYGGSTLFAATNGAAGVLFSHSTPPAGSPSVPMGVSLKAKITSMSPAKQYVGKYVTIKGTTFGSTRGSSYVKFGAVKATSYSSWSATKIVVKVPARSLVRERVVVVTSAGASNYAAFSTY